MQIIFDTKSVEIEGVGNSVVNWHVVKQSEKKTKKPQSRDHAEFIVAFANNYKRYPYTLLI